MESLKGFISGGVGGACVVLVGHPFDTIKVRIQTAEKGQYKGMMDCGRQIIARDGPFGLYRGMLAPLLSVTPIFAVYFWGFDVGKSIARFVEGKKENEKISLAGVCFAGGFSAVPGTVVMTPGDRIKVLLQIQGQSNAPPKYKGPWDAFKTIIREEGVFNGIYKGSGLTLIRDSLGSVAYYAGYEVLKTKLTEGNTTGTLSPGAIMFAGGMAGVMNWLVAVPPDVIKSRYQTAPAGTYPGGMRQVFTELIQKEGFGGLYKGLAPALARAFPANAACFLGVEVARKFLDNFF